LLAEIINDPPGRPPEGDYKLLIVPSEVPLLKAAIQLGLAAGRFLAVSLIDDVAATPASFRSGRFRIYQLRTAPRREQPLQPDLPKSTLTPSIKERLKTGLCR